MNSKFFVTRRIFTSAVAALVLAGIGLAAFAETGSSAPAQGATVDAAERDAPLQSSVARLAAAWNAASGSLWAAEYWPDGELVNILGVPYEGAVAVGGVTSKILAGPFAGSRFAYKVRSVRFLGADAALVEIDVNVTNFRGLPPGAVATQPGSLQTRFTHVFQRRGAVWHIVLSQNTAVTPAPALP